MARNKKVKATSLVSGTGTKLDGKTRKRAATMAHAARTKANPSDEDVEIVAAWERLKGPSPIGRAATSPKPKAKPPEDSAPRKVEPAEDAPSPAAPEDAPPPPPPPPVSVSGRGDWRSKYASTGAGIGREGTCCVLADAYTAIMTRLAESIEANGGTPIVTRDQIADLRSVAVLVADELLPASVELSGGAVLLGTLSVSTGQAWVTARKARKDGKTVPAPMVGRKPKVKPVEPVEPVEPEPEHEPATEPPPKPEPVNDVQAKVPEPPPAEAVLDASMFK